MSTGRFRLQRPGPDAPPPVVSQTNAAAFSAFEFTFRIHPDPTPPPVPRGSFEYDLKSLKYPHKWDSWASFTTWHMQEQRKNGIELRRVKTYKDTLFQQKPGTYDEKIRFFSTVLGNYTVEHNHPVGNENLRFTRISHETREYIAGLLRLKVSPNFILQLLHGGVYHNDSGFEDDENGAVASRNDFIQLRDIRRIEKAIEAESVRLDPDDGQSTLKWVERLQSQGALLGFKAKSDPPPPSSGLEPDTFSLMIQTKWQQKKFQQYGQHLLCIDATHNTTIYEKLLLTTLVVRDKHGHGVPVAWMLASSATQATIYYFLKVHRAHNPSTIPRNIMSDFDRGQINACVDAYHAFIFLCWWHVLHAWQQHFHIGSYPQLWERLKTWIRMTERSDFDATWTQIKAEAPQAFVEYLTQYWMPEHIVRMWSAVYRKDRNIFEACDTNMLIEAWHHVLKGKFLHNKRNRRMDHLLSTLVTEVLPYYSLKQRRQDLGFEGIDIEVKKREDIVKRSKAYVKADIENLEDERFLVRSTSDPSRVYEVDISTYTCTCLDFPLISFCKHICAVQTLFQDELEQPALDAESPCLSDSDLPHDDDDHPQDDSPQGNSLELAAPILEVMKPRALTLMAEKLERLAARLRRPRTKESDLPSLSHLGELVDGMLLATDNSNVLPSTQHVEPNVNDWRVTQGRMRVLPNPKTRAKPAGDPHYGGGAASGSKAAKKAKKKLEPAPAIPPPSIPCTVTATIPATPRAAYPTMISSAYPGPPQLLYQPMPQYYYPFSYTYPSTMPSNP
ncbi:hypothetical protein MVEN_00024400 [Mycena venus]|uniref:SWIM-type domain-containing protein n=1 Tax=Mycena venus TaxID=2733690 RepID=A0A8H7DFY2_9AGAR|nr:hypothetical protein MVEN_00024400 [Mycena venus]